MNDFYSILGVLSTAEMVVIKAAYRALASLYHPDRFGGDAEEAGRRMAELNEAYAILGDNRKRSEYDESRALAEPTFSEFSEPGSQSAERDLIGVLKADWALACEYFPDLDELRADLDKIAHRLAVTFQLYLLETKEFERRKDVAERMESAFLARYFGTNREIIEFSRWQVLQGNKTVLRELSAAVRVLGAMVDPKVITSRLVRDFGAGARRPVDYLEKDLVVAESMWPIFRKAICSNDLQMVRKFVGSTPALVVFRNSSDGNTALHVAVTENHLEVINTLLNAGADPCAKNSFGASPIEHIRSRSRAAVLTIFRRYAADVPAE